MGINAAVIWLYENYNSICTQCVIQNDDVNTSLYTSEERVKRQTEQSRIEVIR